MKANAYEAFIRGGYTYTHNATTPNPFRYQGGMQSHVTVKPMQRGSRAFTCIGAEIRTSSASSSIPWAKHFLFSYLLYSKLAAMLCSQF
eukprot:scaffold49413_cov21-Tisochrysis_lutea.AAC.2